MSQVSKVNDNDPLKSSVEMLELASEYSKAYLAEINSRSVEPDDSALDALKTLEVPLPDNGNSPAETIELLNSVGAPATVATTGGRFFGLVVGGALPATVGARVLNTAWDQLATSQATSPIAIQLEKVAATWLLDLFALPSHSSVGFVSGTTMGNFICLAAARHKLLARQGWNVEEQGLNGAPALHIVASEEIHVTVKKVLAMLGFGHANVDYVPSDENGAMMVDALPELSELSLVLTQAGNVNSGAFDPISDIADKTQEVGAWLHVDGAFGLWAATSRSKKQALHGYENADSWVTDGHKWLNTPYDCGIAICKHPEAMHNAMSTVAPYFAKGFDAAPKDMVPELSRSLRASEVWAALHSLGRAGVEGLINRCCEHANMAAGRLAMAGFEIVNDVVLNQVVVSHTEHEDKMAALADRVCASGEAWFGATHWKGRDAFRMSFSSWVTRDQDVNRAVDAIIDVARAMKILS